ncbi:hypothetical protein A2U01_0090366, partial [Trifolium medium]|nr:hypothetical protein [Trifolium medium]
VAVFLDRRMSPVVSRRWRVSHRGASPRRISCPSILATWGVLRCTLISPPALMPLVPSPR